MSVRLGTVEEALDALRAGKPVIVADSPDCGSGTNWTCPVSSAIWT